MIHTGGREPHKHHCLSKQNGTLMTNDCNTRKMFCCEGGKYFSTMLINTF